MNYTEFTRKAEALLEADFPLEKLVSHKDLPELIHELRVHHIELELQNDELRRAQEELELARDKFADLYDFAPVGYITIGSEGLILEANLTAASLLGLDRTRLLRQPLSRFIAKEDQDAYQWYRYQLFKDGTPQQHEVRLVRKDGESRYVILDGVPVNDRAGLVYRAHLAVSDITVRRQAEETLWDSNRRLEETLKQLKATQHQALQQERLAAVGQLAAGIAHDFNNLLTSILGYAELLYTSPETPETMQADLSRIIAQSRRGAGMVRQILDFSRKSIRQPQLMNLVSFATEVTRFLERTIPESVHISLEVGEGDLPINADPVQIQQMLTNLILNARDALPQGGEVKLRLSRLVLAPGEPSPSPELTPGQWAVCIVADNGAGIPSEILPRIFEPFFTTKEVGAGTGLGLAQVYGIVTQHEGHINVESQLDTGTAFTIYIPLQADNLAQVVEIPGQEIILGRGELVLLVEDEPEVLEVAQAMLKYLGYQVLPAAEPNEALALCAGYTGKIDLVLTDMVMPEMDGLALVQLLKAWHPRLKIVLMSGYPLAGKEDQEVSVRGTIHWLQKPLTLNQVSQVINRALRNGFEGLTEI